MVKYIVLDSDSEASRAMFADVKRVPNAEQKSKVFSINNPILRVINKVHMSHFFNQFKTLPYKEIWDRYYVLEKCKKQSEIEWIVVMTNISVKKIRVEYLMDLNKYSNIHLVLVCVDSFVAKHLCPLAIIERVHFDLVYSFDEHDCNKYNFLYAQSLYSVVYDVNKQNKKRNVFFIGRAKGRVKLLQQIAVSIVNAGYSCDFYILGVPKKDRVPVKGVHYLNRTMSYKKVLSNIIASDCLLDIVQKGQEGLTMRVYEAIFYDKLLVTNNNSVKKNAYFNSDYMIVTDSFDRMNWDFIKLKKGEVSYNYKGEFSPVNFLKEIKEKIKI